VHHLHGYLAHRLFHRTGDRQAAMVAHGRYHLALDLAPGHHRVRASVLHELGLLQASLGNHRIALRHLEERERLPFVSAETELSFRLAKARSLFHGGSYPEAKEEARKALAIVEREPTLGHKRALVLDRSALYHYAAGAHAQGHAIYRELLPLVKGDTLAERVKVRLGLGATALGAGESGEAVRVLGELRELLATEEPLRPEGEPVGLVAAHFGKEDYRTLVAGLLSGAHRAEGQPQEALRAMEERWRLLKARYKRTQQSEDLLEAAVAAHHLGELAYRLGDYGQALRHLEAGLDDADRFRAETGTEVEPVTVALVRALVELHLYGKVPRERFRHEPLRRAEETFAALNARPNPRLAGERFLFTTYLTWMDLRATP
jgi:cellulose synthase operon protein C